MRVKRIDLCKCSLKIEIKIFFIAPTILDKEEYRVNDKGVILDFTI